MKRRKILNSFLDAFSGLAYAFKTERNINLHIFGAVAALATSFYFQVERYELLFVLTAIFMIFITEMINTAVEAVVDLKTEEYHPLARIAKNVAAGAVLCASFFALCVAYLVFAEKVSGLFQLFIL